MAKRELPARPTLAAEVATQGGPRFIAIARSLVSEITRGRFMSGDQLPSSRSLATELGVHRNTVLAALDELVAQGWIRAVPAKGMFVSPNLPTVAPRNTRESGKARPQPNAQVTPGFALPALPAQWRDTQAFTLRSAALASSAKRAIYLSAGVPDIREFPVRELAAAWRRVVLRHGDLLGYGSPHGELSLRVALAALIRDQRAVAVDRDQIVITRGSQQALDLCARALLRPGARVAVEALGYAPAWNALRFAGAQLVPIRVDAHGLSVTALRAAAKRQPIDAVYVTPHHQYPTTVTMSAARRLALGEFAQSHRCLLIEDDYDHEFHFDAHPVAPLAAGPYAAQVVYIGTLSKVLAPGLRIGYLVAPSMVVERLSLWRIAMDRQGDQALEAAVAELIDDGTFMRHMRRMRKLYLERRDVLVAELQANFGARVDVTAPAGGIAVWAKFHHRHAWAPWLAACAARGVTIAPGSRYTFDGSDPKALRLVYASSTPAELRRAVSVMRQCASS